MERTIDFLEGKLSDQFKRLIRFKDFHSDAFINWLDRRRGKSAFSTSTVLTQEIFVKRFELSLLTNSLLCSLIFLKILIVTISGKTLQIVGTKISNGSSYSPTLSIRRQDRHILDLHSSVGFRLKIDQDQRSFLIQLDSNLLGDDSLSGLCGNCNQDQYDDLKLFDMATVNSNSIEFGNQWKLDRHVNV